MSNGKFIVCEGGEGSGKTTQIKMLEQKLTERGYSVLLTREPGGTNCSIAEEIRAILKNPNNKNMTAETELFLFLASRAQHVKEIIKTALEQGKIVLCDRFEASTFAYQHFARGLFDLEEVMKINSFATGGLMPDLTVLLDIEPEFGLKRISDNTNRGNLQDDRFDSEQIEFHQKVRNGFLELAQKLANWQVVQATDSVENVHINVWRQVEKILPQNNQRINLLTNQRSTDRGKLEVICGSMFSGKTEELLRRMKRGQIANLKQKLFKPDKDTRYSANEIKTHDGLGMTAINIPAHQPAMIFNLIEPETEVIGIDEVQFFSPEIVQVCNQLADQGIRVIVAGLDLDFEANPFGPIAGLMATAEHVSKVRAVCEQCGEDANRSFRISHSQDTFQLGEKDNYKALCRSCYVKAINKK